MKRILTLILILAMTFDLLASTVSYPDGSRLGGAKSKQGIRNLVVSLDDKDVGNQTISTNAIYGIVNRVVIDSNGTDTDWSVTLKDENAIALFTKTDCNSAEVPYGYAVYYDDTEGNPHYGIPICGVLQILTADVGSDAEVQTLAPDAAATAGSFWLTYNDETTVHINEVVRISDVNDANGGTFKLTFNSQETAAIDYNSTAAALDTKLEALSSIDVNEVSCTGGPLPDTPILITFTEGLGGQNVGAITLTDNSLTATDPNDTASINIAVVTSGQGLVYNSTISEIQTALETLSTVDVNDIIVGGGPLSEDSNDTTFTFLVADGDVNMISIESSYLTGPTSCPITETTKGGSDLDEISITVYYTENGE